MTNLQRQKKLNEEKWYVSEARREDQSGRMWWCEHCEYQIREDSMGGTKNFCDIPQVDMELNCVCARAYNRMGRKRRANKND